MKQPEDASFDHGARDGMMDLRGILLALRARIGTILAIVATVAIAATIFVFVATPRYAGEAQLLLENRDTAFTRTLSEQELPSGTIDEQAVLSQVQIVTSREVAREAIRRLELVGNSEFDPLVGPMDPITRVRTLLGIASGDTDRREEDRIFSAYYSALTVYNVPRSRVLAIEFRSEDPDLSARAANTIAEVYLEQLEEAKAELARAASDWLGANIEDLRARVSEAEAAVETFRASSQLFLSGDNANISSQQLSDLNTRLAEARSTQADAEARARLISDMIAEGRAFEIPDVANNELIARLIEQRIDLRSQIALEQRTLLPQHPRILELRAQLADLDDQITASAERTVRILENEARIAASRVDSLEEALDAQMSVVAQANESEVQLRALEREARAEREQLENYLTRYREAIARGSQNATLPDARIVSRAVAPSTPVFPRKGPTIVLATLGAAFVATGGVVVAALVSGGPAAPATAGGYGYAMQRREEYDDAFGDPRQALHGGSGYGYAPMDFHSRAAMSAHAASGYANSGHGHSGQDYSRHGAVRGHAGVAGAAAVGAALAEDLDSKSRPVPAAQVHESVHDFPDDPVQAPETLAVDASERPARVQQEAFIDLPLKEDASQETSSQEASSQEQFPPPEEGVLSGVRKVGARLRGTLAPGANGDAGSKIAQDRAVSRERIDAAVAPPREADAADASDETMASDPAMLEAEMLNADLPHEPGAQVTRPPELFKPEALPQEPMQQEPMQQEPMQQEPVQEDAVSQEPVSEEPVPEGRVSHDRETREVPVTGNWQDLEPEDLEPEQELSQERDQSAAASKQPLPESWQELVADAADEQAAVARAQDFDPKGETEADDPARSGSGDVEFNHKPRLRRNNAARARAADRTEAEVQERQLDAAWQETQNATAPAHSAEGTPASASDPSTDPVPVLDDGPAPADAVLVPARTDADLHSASVEPAAGGTAAASDHADAAYDFSALLTRLRENQRQDRGQRVLVSGLGDAERLRRFGEALAQEGARQGRGILISAQGDGRPATAPGLSDLIAERASFFDVIQRDPRSSLHRVERGRGDPAKLIDDGDGLDVALTAFQHTYGLVFMLMPDPGDAELLGHLAAAADTIVIAADREADDPELVDLYARLAGMGSADVVVAGVGRRAGVVAA